MTTGNGTGTFETLAVQAATLLGPVSRRLADGKILPLLTELGMPFAGQLAQTAGLAAAVDACVAAGDQIEDAAERIVQASDGDDLAALSAAALDLVKGVTALIGAVEALSTALSTAAATIANLPPGVLTSFLSELPRRMVDYAVVTTLENNLDVLAGFLELFGVIDRTDENIGSTDPAKPEFTLVRLQLGNLPKLLTSPLGLARDLYGWGTPTFDGTAFFDRVATVLSRVGFPAFFDRMATPPTLELVVAEASVAPTKPEPGISLRLRTGIDETFDGDPDAGLSWSATVRVTAPEGSELIIRPDGQMQLSGPGQASTEGEVRLQAQFEPVDPADAVLVFGQQGGTRLQVQKAHFDFGVTFVWDAGSGAAHGEAGFLLGIDKGELILTPPKGDGFLGQVLPSDNGEGGTEFSLEIGLQRSGFVFSGSASLELVLPVHRTIGPVKVESVALSIGPDGQQLVGTVAASLSFLLGPITVTIDRVGVRLNVSFPESGGNLGPVDLGVAFKPPNGLGLAIDAGVVAGGGFLSFDPDKGQYAGVLEVELAETIQVKVVGILDTVLPDGTPGYSLLLIVAFDLPPIQLGFGFTLNGVGGLFGANRTMSVDALRGGLRAHTLNSVLFPPDPIANAPQIISNVRSFFPPANGRFVFGPMLELGWGTPTLITMELGVLLELPDPVRLAILGLINVGLPSAEEALIELHIDVLGVIDFAAKKLAIDGSLFDSRVLIYALTGDLVMRLTWGSDPNFLFSLGGFNPHFDTSGMNLPPLKRMAVSIGDGDNPRISSNSYFAVTSNTLQFGANTEAFASAGGFSVHGYLGYDVLVVYSPFSFTFDFKASFDVAVDGLTLTAFDIDGTFSGPRPWHLHAHVSIHLLFFDVGASLTLEWGDSTPVALPQRAVLPDLIPALQDARNWSAQLPDGARQAVSLISPKPQEQTLRVHPMGTLTVRETVTPLDLPITRYAQGEPADGSVFAIKAAQVDGHDDGTQPFQDYFAAAQFLTLSDADKLSKPSFESYDAGLTIGLSGIEAGAAAPRTVQYEERIIDVASGFSRFTRVYAMPGEIHAALTQQGAGAQSAVKNGGLAKFQNGPAAAAITSADPRYVVAGVDDLAIRSDIAPGRGMAYFQAQAALATHLALRPEDEGQLQIVPLHEAAA